MKKPKNARRRKMDRLQADLEQSRTECLALAKECDGLMRRVERLKQMYGVRPYDRGRFLQTAWIMSEAELRSMNKESRYFAAEAWAKETMDDMVALISSPDNGVTS